MFYSLKPLYVFKVYGHVHKYHFSFQHSISYLCQSCNIFNFVYEFNPKPRYLVKIYIKIFGLLSLGSLMIKYNNNKHSEHAKNGLIFQILILVTSQLHVSFLGYFKG